MTAHPIQLLIKVANEICERISKPKLHLDDKVEWPQNVYSPPTMERQKDGWACGLYVKMATKPCAHFGGFDGVGDSSVNAARESMLEELLAIPCVVLGSLKVDL